MIAGHFSMDFKKLPSTTPPLAAKYANTLYNTEKRRKREKEGEKKD